MAILLSQTESGIGDRDRKTARAAQIIYTSVEVEDSPWRKGGFQTVFLTQSDLDLDDIEREVEPALAYYLRSGISDQPLPREFVFVAGESNRCVVACITPLIGDGTAGEITDRIGRHKMLLAHALSVSADEFRSVFGNNPFHLVDHFPFFHSFEEVLSRGGVERGKPHIDAVDVECTISDSLAPSQWFQRLQQDREQFKLLLLLASQQATPDRPRRTIQIDGPPQAMLDFLRDAFRLLPPSHRVACSFDTLFVGKVQPKGHVSPHWANGVDVGRQLTQVDAIRLDLESGRFSIEVAQVRPDTPYDLWIEDAFGSPEELEDLITPQMLYAICTLQELCWRRRVDEEDLAAIPDSAFHSFLNVNNDYVRRLLTKNFSSFPGPVETDHLVESAWEWITRQGPKALSRITRPFPRPVLCNWLLPLFLERTQQSPGTEGLNAIQRCIRNEPRSTRTNEPNPPQQMMTAIYHRWRADWVRFGAAAACLDDAGFNQITRWALLTVSPTASMYCGIAPEQGELGVYVTVASMKPQCIDLLAALLGRVRVQVENTEAVSQSPRYEWISQKCSDRRRWGVVFDALFPFREGVIPWVESRAARAATGSPPQNSAQVGEQSTVATEDASGAADIDHRAVTAEQIIADHVIRTDSSGGWQTRVWSSIGEDAASLLKPVFCVPDDAEHAVHVFLQVPIRQRHMCLVAEVRRIVEGTSEANNSRRILIHALLFDADEFEQSLENDPFRVIDSGYLHSFNFREFEESPGTGASPIPSLQIPMTDPRQEAVLPLADKPTYPREVLRQLLLFAVCDSRDRLRLVGHAGSADELLRLMFKLLPRSARQTRSFHTRAILPNGKKIDAAASYWCVSTPDASGASRDEVSFDMSSNRFSSAMRLTPATPFERWFDSRLSEGYSDLAATATNIEAAFQLGRGSSGDEAFSELTCEESDQLITEFLNMNPDWIAGILRAKCGNVLADAINDSVSDWVKSTGQHGLFKLQNGPIDNGWILERLIESIERRPHVRPSHAVLREARKRLHGGAASNTDKIYKAILARLENRWREMAEWSVLLDEDSFERFGRWCLESLRNESRRLPFHLKWYRNNYKGELRFGLQLIQASGTIGDATRLVAALLGRVVAQKWTFSGRAWYLEKVNRATEKTWGTVFRLLEETMDRSRINE